MVERGSMKENQGRTRQGKERQGTGIKGKKEKESEGRGNDRTGREGKGREGKDREGEGRERKAEGGWNGRGSKKVKGGTKERVRKGQEKERKEWKHGKGRKRNKKVRTSCMVCFCCDTTSISCRSTTPSLMSLSRLITCRLFGLLPSCPFNHCT